jgi:transcription elongation factor GreA
MIAELNTRVHRQLTHLVEELTERIPARLGNDQDHAAYRSTVDQQRLVQRRIHYLRRVAAGLSQVQGEALSEELVGFGSAVRVQDLQTGEILSYTLMTGEELDLDAGEISLASPVGHALLGRAAGDEVEVVTPQRRRRFRVLSIDTIFARLREEAPPLECA